MFVAFFTYQDFSLSGIKTNIINMILSCFVLLIITHSNPSKINVFKYFVLSYFVLLMLKVTVIYNSKNNTKITVFITL